MCSGHRELFGLLTGDDRELLRDEAALREWVEQELLAHAEKLTELLLTAVRPALS